MFLKETTSACVIALVSFVQLLVLLYIPSIGEIDVFLKSFLKFETESVLRMNVYVSLQDFTDPQHLLPSM